MHRFVSFFVIFSELPVTDEMGIYMINTEDERSLFTFHLRPWKVEKSMQTEVVCGKKQGTCTFTVNICMQLQLRIIFVYL